MDAGNLFFEIFLILNLPIRNGLWDITYVLVGIVSVILICNIFEIINKKSKRWYCKTWILRIGQEWDLHDLAHNLRQMIKKNWEWIYVNIINF